MTTTNLVFKLPLDHVVIVVPDLMKSVALFKSQGFHVDLGGRNGPTHNALIFFKDGKYIELISLRSTFVRLAVKVLSTLKPVLFFRDNEQSINARFMNWFGGKSGLKDWCVRSNNIQETASALREHDHLTTKVEEFKRVRPDGQVAKWLLTGPTSRSLPFIIEDISPTRVRVPFLESCNHANGVTGISSLIMNHQHLDTTDQKIRSLFSVLETDDSFVTNVRVEHRPDKPTLSIELTSDSMSKGQIFPAKDNFNINIV